jgi:hypothetical protein
MSRLGIWARGGLLYVGRPGEKGDEIELRAGTVRRALGSGAAVSVEKVGEATSPRVPEDVRRALWGSAGEVRTRAQRAATAALGVGPGPDQDVPVRANGAAVPLGHLGTGAYVGRTVAVAGGLSDKAVRRLDAYRDAGLIRAWAGPFGDWILQYADDSENLLVHFRSWNEAVGWVSRTLDNFELEDPGALLEQLGPEEYNYLRIDGASELQLRPLSHVTQGGGRTLRRSGAPTLAQLLEGPEPWDPVPCATTDYTPPEQPDPNLWEAGEEGAWECAGGGVLEARGASVLYSTGGGLYLAYLWAGGRGRVVTNHYGCAAPQPAGPPMVPGYPGRPDKPAPLVRWLYGAAALTVAEEAAPTVPEEAAGGRGGPV